MAITADHRLDMAHQSVQKGFWARLSDAIVHGQLDKASHEIPVHLRALDDATLKSFGYTDAQVTQIRSHGLF